MGEAALWQTHLVSVWECHSVVSGGTYIIIKGIFWKDQSINDLTVQKENLSQPKIQFKKERL